MKHTEYTRHIEQLYHEYKPLLSSIAYRMLGSITESEDAVQDVFVVLSKQPGIQVQHPRAYLVKLLTNRTLNMMKATPRKREHYPGLWLPEPVIEFDTDHNHNPQELVLRREQLGYALLVLLQACTPLERAVFVLRESFAYSYTEIASLMDKKESACRKIFSRAAAKISQNRHENHAAALDASIDKYLQSFAQALSTGRFDSFIRLLTDDAVLLSDGGGLVRSALNPINGAERISAFFKGISRKGSLAGQLLNITISGQQGLLLQREQQPPTVFALEPSDQSEAVRAIYMISNPEKLGLERAVHLEK